MPERVKFWLNRFEEETRKERMNENNIIKLPKFNGKKEFFLVWFSQFNATCSVKGCAEALGLNIKKKLPASEREACDATTCDGKEKNGRESTECVDDGIARVVEVESSFQESKLARRISL